MRVSTHATYTSFLANLQVTYGKLVRAQAKGTSGLEIQRPSDDPIGMTRILNLRHRLSDNQRYLGAIEAGRPLVDSAAASLQEGSNLMNQVRGLIVQGMNGTLSAGDRDTLATEIEAVRAQLLEIANARFDGRYLFAGTATDAAPWTEAALNGTTKAIYQGNDDQLQVQVGDGASASIGVAGSEIFGAHHGLGAEFSGLSGLQSGLTADMGSGYETLQIAHTATDPGTLGTVGVALVDGGAQDSLLGDNDLVIDAAAGTIQLGGGPVLSLPAPGSPGVADFALENDLGGELHLDLTGWTGASLTAVVHGDGELSLDGSTWVPIDFAATDLELANPATGNVLHVDTTGLAAATQELVTYAGTTNVFDALQGFADELCSGDQIDHSDAHKRFGLLLDEFDRNHDNLLSGLSSLGARSQRLSDTRQRLDGIGLQFEAILSSVEDADFNEVITEIAESQQTLEMIQATGARILRTTLLNHI